MRNNHVASNARWRPLRPASACRLLVIVMTTAVAPVALAADAVTDELAVRVTPSIVLAAQDVRTLVTVPRHPENRRLVVTVEGPSYYASTERQLDGDGAARMHEFAFRQLPEGEYRVQVSVEGIRGPDAGIEARFTVRGVPLDVPTVPGPTP